MSPHPSIVLVLLKDTVQRYHDTVEDKRGTTLSRARIVSQDFPRKCSCIFQTIPRNNPFHWEATSRILRLLGRNLGQFADVTYLTILEIVSINRPTRISDNFYGHFPSCFFLVSLFITCVLRERIVWRSIWTTLEDFGLFRSEKLFRGASKIDAWERFASYFAPRICVFDLKDSFKV